MVWLIPLLLVLLYDICQSVYCSSDWNTGHDRGIYSNESYLHSSFHPSPGHKIRDLHTLAWARIKCTGPVCILWAAFGCWVSLGTGSTWASVLPLKWCKVDPSVARLWQALLLSILEPGSMGPAAHQGSSNPFKLITSQENAAYATRQIHLLQTLHVWQEKCASL